MGQALHTLFSQLIMVLGCHLRIMVAVLCHRDGKGTTYEGGQRVPCVVKGPGIPAGSETAEIMTTMDLLPTIAKLAGVELKTRGEIDGIDTSQLMLGAEKSPRNEFVYYSSRGELNGLRQGDFKLRIAKPRKKKGQKGPVGPATVELYNLKDDISEKVNLAEKMPEKVKALKERMEDLDVQLSKQIFARVEI